MNSKKLNLHNMEVFNFGHWMLRWAVLNAAVFLLGLIDLTVGHGRLWEPPSRSSMWRRGYNTTVNINDNELSCGGFTNQWISYSGLCGVCGDPYQQHPRDNEIGGKYAAGIITRTYPIGGTIDVVIGLTANHMGYFEFKICPILDPSVGETQACMDNHQLKIVNGEDKGYKFYIRDQTLGGHVKLTLLLPRNFLCKHCVLQWRYRTGTRWGCDQDLLCGKGKGPQEEFYGCSDISIEDVSRTIYHEPAPQTDRNKAKQGLIHLGGTKTHTVIWSIEPTPEPSYRTSKYTDPTEYVTETQTPSPLSIRHNKHMSTLRHFLEELTLNALYSYYGKKENYQHFRCGPTKRYERNPIVNEFCRKVCSYDTSICPDILCACVKDPVQATEMYYIKPSKSSLFNSERHKLDRNHLKKFVRKLVARNRLVENVPTIKLRKPFIKRTAVNKSQTSESVIPTLGRMEVVHSSPKRVPILPSYTGSTKALQEHNFISMFDVKNAVADSENDLHRFMTTKGLDFDPDKIVHLQSQQIIKPNIMICTASVAFAHNPFMAKWCNTNCPFGFCPPRVCSCNY
ncbi:uncharacterized protein LOC123528283 [Mercenaria mercenaria]|uniref:uncharacterized protein LOC123528283 n=1 Tax=Mercenaria mercenaria TaxID=6596 RepID=UPI00234FA285|nr:uncharacterized protein LOC123528283 [Mercenaria mercenaria]